MFDRYLVTGATGFLGRVIVEKLIERGAEVAALVMPGDPNKKLLPQKVRVFMGDVCNKSSMNRFFDGADSRTCVIHCAGIVSVASRPGCRLHQVNEGGTWKITRQCAEHQVGRLIYISSVHAMPEKPKGTVITEDCDISPGLVYGEYARSKAAATSLVFEAVQRGLNASVVFPSGIIGPGDLQGGSLTTMARRFLAGRLPIAVRGGYDFVDVRDVAEGVLACAEHGQTGKGYILSGHYITVREMLQTIGEAAGRPRHTLYLPLWLAALAAPRFERYSIKARKPLLFTPYSMAVLGSNGHFSHDAASEAFDYQPRPMKMTLRDMTLWLMEQENSAE